MEKNAEYYKNKLELEPAKCNGYVKCVSQKMPHFNFAYYLLEGDLICPWHRMGTLETCHYIDGDPIEIIYMRKIASVYIPTIYTLSEDNLHLFLDAGTWCAFYLPQGSTWSLISHFHIPPYKEKETEYACPEDFKVYFPELQELAEKYGLRYFYNRKS